MSVEFLVSQQVNNCALQILSSNRKYLRKYPIVGVPIGKYGFGNNVILNTISCSETVHKRYTFEVLRKYTETKIKDDRNNCELISTYGLSLVTVILYAAKKPITSLHNGC